MSTVSPSPDAATRTVPCRAGLCRLADATGLFIVSPRTGRRIAIACDAAPMRLRGRIAQAAGAGRLIVEFTINELWTLLTLADVAEVAAERPLPSREPIHGGWIRRVSRARRWGR